MRDYDFTFKSTNAALYAKPITVYVVEPDQIRRTTGLLHCAHGWAGNRFQYADLMKEFANRYDVICIATEFRQSGYDSDPVVGSGYDVPYDASFHQVIDCLNAVRQTLHLYPAIDRSRLMLFGGSQGGHITLLMAAFAPDTFACAVAACSVARMDDERVRWAGREFSADELAIRDAVFLSPRIRCPVALMHGTADDLVPDAHTREIESALRKAGTVEVRSKYYEGGGHGLEPVTDRQAATIELADDLLRGARHAGADDFAAARRVVIPCVSKQLVLDWSRDVSDVGVMTWEPKI